MNVNQPAEFIIKIKKEVIHFNKVISISKNYKLIVILIVTNFLNSWKFHAIIYLLLYDIIAFIVPSTLITCILTYQCSIQSTKVSTSKQEG